MFTANPLESVPKFLVHEEFQDDDRYASEFVLRYFIDRPSFERVQNVHASNHIAKDSRTHFDFPLAANPAQRLSRKYSI